VPEVPRSDGHESEKKCIFKGADEVTAESESSGRVYKPIFIEEAFFLSSPSNHHSPSLRVFGLGFVSGLVYQVRYCKRSS
jgi:hypothetical protein